MSSSSSSYRPPLVMIRSSPPRLPCSDLSIIEPWRLYLDQYTIKITDLYLRTNLNFIVVFFVLMPPPNSIDSTSSASSRALKFWTNTISSDTNCCAKLICFDSNYCVQNLGYHTYYDTNSWEIRRSSLTTSSTPCDRLPRAHKMNIKRYKKKNAQFNVIRPKLGLCPWGKNLRELY